MWAGKLDESALWWFLLSGDVYTILDHVRWMRHDCSDTQVNYLIIEKLIPVSPGVQEPAGFPEAVNPNSRYPWGTCAPA